MLYLTPFTHGLRNTDITQIRAITQTYSMSAQMKLRH